MHDDSKIKSGVQITVHDYIRGGRGAAQAISLCFTLG